MATFRSSHLERNVSITKCVELVFGKKYEPAAFASATKAPAGTTYVGHAHVFAPHCGHGSPLPAHLSGGFARGWHIAVTVPGFAYEHDKADPCM
jgi:hypothetical protein